MLTWEVPWVKEDGKVSAEIADKILDQNARALYGI